jgi:hypothetical protein
VSKLFEIVPLPYRWLALAGLAAALIGWGYVHGYLHEERKFDVYQAQVDVIGKEAAKRAAERRAAQDTTTKEIRDAHAADVARIRAYYAGRLRDAAARRGAVPADPDGAGRADGAASECGPGDEGDEDVALIELEQRAALDAEKVLKLQAFLRENGFPVK